MTLSRWLRDYLYIPLGGNRKGQTRTYVNIVPDDGARRPVARRRLDVRLLGRAHGGALVIEHRRIDVRKARFRRRTGALPGEAVTGDLGFAGADAGGPRAAGEDTADFGFGAPAPTGATVDGAPCARLPPAGRRRARLPSRAAAPELDLRPWGGGVWPRVGTFAFVTFAWVFFRSASFGAALERLRAAVPRLGLVGAAVTPGGAAGDRRRHRHPVRAAQLLRARRGRLLGAQPARCRASCSPSASCCSTCSAPPAPPASSTSSSDGRPRHGQAAHGRRRRTAASALVAILVALGPRRASSTRRR